MNKLIIKICLLVCVAIISDSANVFAQASDNASITANIITPITIIKGMDMNFGNAAVQIGAGGSVILAPSGARTATAGVTLPSIAGTVTSAQFTVSGAANYTYAITLPNTVVIYDALNAHNMTVNSFSSNPSVIGTLSALGSQRLDIGATLWVGSGQTAGLYSSSSPFNVTVNYN
jgi:hypothetical protein